MRAAIRQVLRRKRRSLRIGIDCGSMVPYIDTAGRTWIENSFSSIVSGGAVESNNRPGAVVQNTLDPEIYLSFIYSKPRGILRYQIPILAGLYTVRLMFCEFFASSRIADVYINSTRVLTAFDVFAESGNSVALDKIFTNTPSLNGFITIDLDSLPYGGGTNFYICGIEINPT